MKQPKKIRSNFFDSLAYLFSKLTFAGIGFMILCGVGALVLWLFGWSGINWDMVLGITVLAIVFFSLLMAFAMMISGWLHKRRGRANLPAGSGEMISPREWLAVFFDRQMTQLELQDIREVELKLWAAERKLEFREHDKVLSKKIYSLFSSIARMNDDSSHFIIGEEPPGRYLVFRHTSRLLKAQTKQEPKPKKTELTGVAVILEDQTVPSFTLVDKSIADKVVFKDGILNQSKLETLNSKQFPDWLDWREFRCYCPAGEIDLVVRFLEQSGPLRLITHGTSVRLIGFQEDMVCAFFESQLKADGANYAQFERFAMRMLELWGKEETLTEKALKAESGED